MFARGGAVVGLSERSYERTHYMKDLVTIPNVLSLSRIPLGLFFLIDDSYLRLLLVVLATASDVLDGFLARRLRSHSRFGAILDPVTDKFFVFFVLAVFLCEGRLTLMQLFYFSCRDISLVLFFIYLYRRGLWKGYTIRSFVAGKVTTSLQFITLALLCMGREVPMGLFVSMAAFGCLSFAELFFLRRPA